MYIYEGGESSTATAVQGQGGAAAAANEDVIELGQSQPPGRLL